MWQSSRFANVHVLRWRTVDRSRAQRCGPNAKRRRWFCRADFRQQGRGELRKRRFRCGVTIVRKRGVALCGAHRCRRVDPVTLPLKGIGRQRNTQAVFVGIEPIPRKSRLRSATNIQGQRVLSPTWRRYLPCRGEREWQCMDDLA